MIHDTLSNWPRYFKTPSWQCVFEFLFSLNTEAEDCKKIPLQGEDIYASIMSYETCGPDEAKLEAHDHYIDIQMSLVNSEGIDWYPRSILTVKIPYDSERDRTLYVRPEENPTRINNYPGQFTVLFPEDAHMPKQITGGFSEQVKKVVVKLNRRLIPGVVLDSGLEGKRAFRHHV
ncbi:MAG TPA: YhcH/YjgK/YiaL family protein [Candidatus Hydrogenedentes bacterium]|nr:YhcH/YjgK/YiaL family protein [Candidatus Hydrogenedentota bacterium]HQM99624.1 YhcH/YjgK/YiaL family protein [Candidatus Hydrogenedentota bacterium]